ncbi:MobV family relaxase [Bacteroides thetaiotaomicron]|uniref:MobV family relaxase n=1 Tax=Bacteroides thetaiotaomicron TaxID=818 RepID=UPI002165975B|nr:MobV family relaxase [Bacteroides thetaiotaomicron]MCS3039789.1 plasmid recombination protein [Bacteroides thetaiotaomicron]
MNENYRFVSERFGGKKRCGLQSLHMDERTPHIHCVVVPLTRDGRLSAKEVMGDRRKLSELQDCYGKAMQNKFGLQRGIKGSTATHDSVRGILCTYKRVRELDGKRRHQDTRSFYYTPTNRHTAPHG